MKLAFIVHNSLDADRVMNLLKRADIDYYTRWGEARGKGHGTEPHLGMGAFGSTNTVMMIGFPETAPLERLIELIVEENKIIPRPDDRIRLFQVPLERIV